jgi:hypothetical protein
MIIPVVAFPLAGIFGVAHISSVMRTRRANRIFPGAFVLGG